MKENKKLKSSGLLKLSGNHYDDQNLLQSFVLFNYSWFYVASGNRTSDLTANVSQRNTGGEGKQNDPQTKHKVIYQTIS